MDDAEPKETSTAVFLEHLNFVYTLSPRTASTATGGAIRRLYRGRRVAEKKHVTIQGLATETTLTPEQLETSVKVTTIRNPFDSVYSLWHKMTHQYYERRNDPDVFFAGDKSYIERLEAIKEMSFSDWFIKQYQDTGKEHSVYLKWARGADRLLRFETLADDFDALIRDQGGRAKGAIPFGNKTDGRRREYWQHYSAEARALGEQVFRQELQKHGYAF